ncbi:unnamed protein product [Anisakis simplex]|uniref:Uncharacterized protein n=1 Tax=Anisakis simplex TaxID=6269 RepID=A0A3P6PAD2_ANISI|nr:unnamed protein product [Anisakis simplex]
MKYELDYAGGGAQQKKQPSAPPYEGEETSTHSILFWIVVIFVIAMFVFALIPSPASRAGHRDGSSRGKNRFC